MAKKRGSKEQERIQSKAKALAERYGIVISPDEAESSPRVQQPESRCKIKATDTKTS